MADAYMLAIDLAKRSFQVCATDRAGSCVEQGRPRRTFRADCLGHRPNPNNKGRWAMIVTK